LVYNKKGIKTARGDSLVDKKGKSFTLIELIVVIAIISTLAAIITPNIFRAIKKAQISRTIESFEVIKAATLHYYTDTGQWVPSHYIINDTGPFFQDNGVPGWGGPYLERYEKSPLVQDAVPGGSHPGWYYVLQDNQMYDSTFDLDRDGTYDITDGISVCCYGFPSADAYRIDEIVDGVGEWGYKGTMNLIRIWSTSPRDSYYLVSLLIGQTGVPRGSR